MPFDLFLSNLFAAIAEPGVQFNAGFSEISWSILIPLILNGGMLFYAFGVLSQKIKSLENDFGKIDGEIKSLRETNSRAEANLHRIEITLSKMETRFDMFLTAASEHSKCPLIKGVSDELRQK